MVHHQDAKGHASFCKPQAGTACCVPAPVPCPWDRACLPGLEELQMPKRVTEQGQHCSPALPGLPELPALLFPTTFLRGAVPPFISTFRKITVQVQGEERGTVPSNDMGTEICREWLPMAHESHQLGDDLWCAAHH